MACPGHAVLGRVIRKTLRTTNLQSITTKCKQRLSLGRSLGRPCPRRHALGMLSLAGSVLAPCERRTYTRKQNPNIFMQWGWELSQQWSSGEFREIKVCNQKGQKGSTGRLGISASSYVEQLRTDLRQQAPPDRGRTFQFELQALLLKASKNGKLSLVDICPVLTLQVGHASGGWICKDDIASNIVDKLIGELPDTSAAASAPAVGFVFAL